MKVGAVPVQFSSARSSSFRIMLSYYLALLCAKSNYRVAYFEDPFRLMTSI